MAKKARQETQPLPSIPRTKSKPPQECACGCGEETRGGRFLPGHDSRLYGWALRVSRGQVKLAEIQHSGERAAVKRYLSSQAGQAQHAQAS